MTRNKIAEINKELKQFRTKRCFATRIEKLLEEIKDYKGTLLKYYILIAFISFILIGQLKAAEKHPYSNLAIGQPVSSSSVDGPYPPYWANNGMKFKKFTFWRSNDKPTPAWWQVDLGKAEKIGEIRITYATVPPSIFIKDKKLLWYLIPKTTIIQTSEDGKTYTDAYTISADQSPNLKDDAANEAKSGKPRRYVLPKGTKGRYIRLVFPEGSKNKKRIALGEVEVYPVSSRTIKPVPLKFKPVKDKAFARKFNLTAPNRWQAPVKAKSAVARHPADMATDGIVNKEGNCWIDAGKGATWWMINLGQLCMLDKIGIAFSKGKNNSCIAPPKDIKVQVSYDGDQFWTIGFVSSDKIPNHGDHYDNTWFAIQLPEGTKAAFVRLQFPHGSKSPDNGHTQLGEVKITSTWTNDFSIPSAWKALGKNDVLPKPWTPIVSNNDDTLRVWGREYCFGGKSGGLFSQISSQGVDLLAQPLALQAKINGMWKDIVIKRIKWKEKTDSHYTGVISGYLGPFEVTGKISAEFDGFIRFTLKMAARTQVTIEQMRLTAPFRQGIAQLYHTPFTGGSPLDSGAILSSGFAMSRENYAFWIGNDDLGIEIITEEYFAKQLPVVNNKGSISVHTKKNGQRTLFWTFNKKPFDTKGEIKLDFALMASPVKPMPTGWREWQNTSWTKNGSAVVSMCKAGRLQTSLKNTILNGKVEREKTLNTINGNSGWVPLWFWESSYGRPQPASWDWLKARIDDFHKVNLMLFPYITAAASGIYDSYRGKPQRETINYLSEWERIPRRIWGYPREAEHRFLCPASSWADSFVHDMDELFRRNPTLDGVYIDNFYTMACSNSLHGCSGKYPIYAHRNFWKRVMKVVKKHNPDAKLIAHMSGCVELPILSFVDAIYDGEQLLWTRYNINKADCHWSKIYMPNLIRAEFRGGNFGLVPMLMPAPTRTSLKASRGRELAAVCLLNDVLLQIPAHWYKKLKLDKQWQLKRKFGIGASNVKFHPYWSQKLLVPNKKMFQ